MANKKARYASLHAGMIRRGIVTRRTQIIGPDGKFAIVFTPIEVMVDGDGNEV